MAQTSRPCKGCGEPIYRTAPVAPIPYYHGPECRPRCCVEGCEKPQHSKGMCGAHARRAARYGDPLTPLQRQPNEGLCSVDGCPEPMRKRTWCAKHYAMWRRHGEIREWSYSWGSGGYVSTHTWLRRHRGKAADHICADCGSRAEEWSYVGSHPEEQRDPTHGGAAFVRDLDAYVPRCVKCHRLFDENPIATR